MPTRAVASSWPRSRARNPMGPSWTLAEKGLTSPALANFQRDGPSPKSVASDESLGKASDRHFLCLERPRPTGFGAQQLFGEGRAGSRPRRSGVQAQMPRPRAIAHTMYVIEQHRNAVVGCERAVRGIDTELRRPRTASRPSRRRHAPCPWSRRSAHPPGSEGFHLVQSLLGLCFTVPSLAVKFPGWPPG